MGKTVSQRIKEIGNLSPDSEVMVFYDSGLRRTALTYKQLYTLSSRFAHVLRKSGVKRGDVVCVALPVSPELAVAFYGAMFAGAIAVASEVTPDKANVFYHCINKSEAKCLVVRTDPEDQTWTAIKDNVSNINQETLTASINDPAMPKLTTLMIADRHDEASGSKDFLSMLQSYPDSFEDPDMEEKDICGVWLTSGTTGMPKLVMRTHKSFVDVSIMDGGLIPGAKKLFNNASWSWMLCSPYDIMNQCCRVQIDTWRPHDNMYKLISDVFKMEKIIDAFLTPPEMEQIVKYWDISKEKLCDRIMVGGYQVTKALATFFLSIANKVVIRYGCSEMIGISSRTISSVDQMADGDTGKLYPGVKVKAVNDQMEELPKGTAGRLMLHSNGVFSGYLNDADKTEEALVDGGWFLTSDAGYLDENDHLIVVGRFDYIIRHKNLQIYPSTIELVIQKIPQVKTVHVVPIPDETNHHNICACIVLESGAQLSEDDVRKYVTANYYKKDIARLVAPHYVLFIDDIKVNERGKTNTNQIIQHAVNTIKGMKTNS